MLWRWADLHLATFERLWEAWVMQFQHRQVPYSKLAARPWEDGCRTCGKKDRPHLLVTCDHCDAEQHLDCLSPKLAWVPAPEDRWLCERCGAEGVNRGASATVEDRLRQRIEDAHEAAPETTRVTKYLVKWKGVSCVTALLPPQT